VVWSKKLQNLEHSGSSTHLALTPDPDLAAAMLETSAKEDGANLCCPLTDMAWEHPKKADKTAVFYMFIILFYYFIIRLNFTI